jgi:hypothetical protein
MSMGHGDGDGDSPAPAGTGMNPRGYKIPRGDTTLYPTKKVPPSIERRENTV